MREKILELRALGYSYNQIAEAIPCSKSTVSYHLGEGQKEKAAARRNVRRFTDPVLAKHERFLYAKGERPPRVDSSEIVKAAYEKARSFQRRVGSKLATKMTKVFTFKDVEDIHGEDARCYLTGEPIDLKLPSTYAFDHIVPASKGGGNGLDNLGLCTTEVNYAKRDMSVEDFVNLCRKVVAYYDSKENN